ncbi:hypothetical protein [Chakrabartyella piscis]|uniref:hypothetical protein n=1 Tax=Chakrabartyella piscis TaxID=2918914 RepID=UPI002958704E|nr:hypothetical protein [Chakrabartyella piscis]
MNQEEYLEKLLSSYQSYFDIERDVNLENRTLAATAFFHSRSEKYVLSKKAQLWATEMNEYVYFAFADVLTADDFLTLKEDVLQAGLQKIKPHKEHMYSYVSLVVVTDLVSEDAKKAIKKAKFHKTYQFSLHGWMYLRIAVVELSNHSIYANKQGEDMTKLLQEALS